MCGHLRVPEKVKQKWLRPASISPRLLGLCSIRGYSDSGQDPDWWLSVDVALSLPTHPQWAPSSESLRIPATGWAGRWGSLGSTPTPSLSSSISNKHEITSID